MPSRRHQDLGYASLGRDYDIEGSPEGGADMFVCFSWAEVVGLYATFGFIDF
jgi:hypothetical protein